MDPVELLRRRAVRFYDYARIAFDNGDYDITVFMCEQAAQLYTKNHSSSECWGSHLEAIGLGSY
jgi:uncharacterized protein YigE (DUF2233 family)